MTEEEHIESLTDQIVRTVMNAPLDIDMFLEAHLRATIALLVMRYPKHQAAAILRQAAIEAENTEITRPRLQ